MSNPKWNYEQLEICMVQLLDSEDNLLSNISEIKNELRRIKVSVMVTTAKTINVYWNVQC